jgi:hypothetical protein
MRAGEMRSPQAVHRSSRFIERVYLGRDAVRRRQVEPNSAALPPAAISSERRKP